jgi:hypothetical protein
LSVGHQVARPHGQDDIADGVQDQLGLLVLDVVAAPALIRTVALLRRVVTEIRGLLIEITGLLIALASLVGAVAAMTRHWL